MEQLHQGDHGCYPDAYIDYLVQFQAVRDYFECHEILEEYWKQHPDSPYRETWVMLIQLAVSLYHHRRGNLRGAVKLMKGALRRYQAEHMAQLGVDGARLREMMEKRLTEYIEQPERPFRILTFRSQMKRCRIAVLGEPRCWVMPGKARATSRTALCSTVICSAIAQQ